MKETNELEKIEKLEKKYFDEIDSLMKKNINWVLTELKSKNEIKEDWLTIFKKTARQGYDKASELDCGAERVIHNLFGQYKSFSVQSCPVGSDLMFEVQEAYIHIEVKTATDDNSADYSGKIQLAQNQTSYSVEKKQDGEDYPFRASLPKIYSNGKLCLTYVIQIIHDNDEDEPKIISLFCIPNGALHETYGDCVNSGKHEKGLNKLDSRGDIRFLYKLANKFENLTNKPSRIVVLYPQNPTTSLLKKYLGFNFDNQTTLK